LCRAVDGAGQTAAPLQWEGPQPIVGLRARAQPKKQQLGLELGRGECDDGVCKDAVRGRQTVHRCRDKGVCAKRDRELGDTVRVPPGWPVGGCGGTGGRPTRALCGRKLRIHLGPGRRRRPQHRGEVRGRGDDDHVVVDGADHGRGVVVSEAFHGEVHGRGVQQGTKRVTLLHAALDAQPQARRGAGRPGQRGGVSDPAVHAWGRVPPVHRLEVRPQEGEGARDKSHRRR